jgi:hypothetical protein
MTFLERRYDPGTYVCTKNNMALSRDTQEENLSFMSAQLLTSHSLVTAWPDYRGATRKAGVTLWTTVMLL